MDRGSPDGVDPDDVHGDNGDTGQPAGPPPQAAGGAADPVGGEPGEAARLQELVDDLRSAERHTAAAVLKASDLAAAGVAERVTGQPLSFALGVACRLTGADRATLLAAGDVLDDMPVVRGWFADGHVSWGEAAPHRGGPNQLIAERGHRSYARSSAYSSKVVNLSSKYGP